MIPHQQLTLNRTNSSYGSLVDTCSLWVSKYLYSRTTQLIIDGAAVGSALWIAYLIRFDGVPPEAERRQFALVLPFILALYGGVNVLSGLYKRVWRFINLTDAVAIGQSVAGAALVLVLWRTLDSGVLTHGPVPFGVLLIHPLLAFTALVGVRLTRRTLYHRAVAKGSQSRFPSVRRQVLLIGAGEAGLQLLRQLRNSDFDVVGFLDDGLELQGRSIGGCCVLGRFTSWSHWPRDIPLMK